MSSLVIVGAQWGDEGKGKIVDALAGEADVVVRFQGGDNAGHTVYCAGRKYVFHILPSGILRRGVLNIIGAGVVVNLERLREELAEIGLPAREWRKRLRISGAAHLILPFHRLLDRIMEERMGKAKIGTTLRGIGPAYADRAARTGIRVADALDADYLRARLKLCLAAKRGLLPAKQLGAAEIEHTAQRILELLAPLRELVVDAAALLHTAHAAGRRILYEGAQGTMLDIGFGSYPYVTSSHTISGGVCVGAGVGPHAIDRVWGVTKAYATRVGEGPFPSELKDAVGDRLRELGGEYGATTQRPRRCGWLDLVQLRRAVMLNGLDGLILTKLDILDNFDQIGVCTAYEINGQRLREFPVNPVALEKARPVFEFWPGWRASTSAARSFAELPRQARRYVAAVEKAAGVPIVMISAGNDRRQLIVRRKPF